MRHAIVNKDGQVVNVIIWEGAEFLPPKDHYVIKCNGRCDIGDNFDFNNNWFVHADRTSENTPKVTGEKVFERNKPKSLAQRTA